MENLPRSKLYLFIIHFLYCFYRFHCHFRLLQSKEEKLILVYQRDTSCIIYSQIKSICPDAKPLAIFFLNITNVNEFMPYNGQSFIIIVLICNRQRVSCNNKCSLHKTTNLPKMTTKTRMRMKRRKKKLAEMDWNWRSCHSWVFIIMRMLTDTLCYQFQRHSLPCLLSDLTRYHFALIISS